MEKTDADPVHPTDRLNAARRCTARSKQTGLPCKSPAVRGWKVCRMHGARGGGPRGQRNGAWKHGERSEEAEMRRALVRMLTCCTR